MNLVTDPWLPVRYTHGKTAEVGLRHVFAQADTIAALNGETPLLVGGMYRLLFAVARRSMPTAAPADWQGDTSPGQCAVRDYLARWQSRFDLFDPDAPFYQDARLATSTRKVKTLSNLMYSQASGNNATIFDWHTDDRFMPVTPAYAARMLVGFMAFALAGTAGPYGTFTDAPWARGKIFIARGATLAETLGLNHFSVPADFPTTGGDDYPMWEDETPFAALEAEPQRAVRGYVDYLTWPIRRLYLERDEANQVYGLRWSPGFRLPENLQDPHKHWRYSSNTKHYYALRFDPQRELWRELAGLLTWQAEADAEEATPAAAKPAMRDILPVSLMWGREVAGGAALQCLVVGMASNQTRVDGIYQAGLDLPTVYFRDADLQAQIGAALAEATALERAAWGAQRTLARYMVARSGESKPSDEDVVRWQKSVSLAADYWKRLEQPFWRLVQDLPPAPAAARAAWVRALLQLAQTIYGALSTPDNWKASVLAQAQWGSSVSRTLKIKHWFKQEGQMATSGGSEDKFIGYLERLRDKPDRAALSALRRGVNQAPGTVPSTFQYVTPWVHAATPAWREAALYLTASLFAYHSAAGGQGNLGAAGRRVGGAEDSGIERRFTRLLEATAEDLPEQLYAFVTLLRSKNIPLDYRRLLYDLTYWSHPDNFVRPQWARAFWSPFAVTDAAPSAEAESA